MSDELARALDVALGAAREAAATLRAEFHRPGGPRGRGAHADVDIEVERVIRARLLGAFPDWGYRGEETGSAGVDPPPRFLWLVDPNDGTRNYLMGDRGPAVSIGLLRDREPVLGVVFAPCAPDDDGDLIAWADECGPPTRNGKPFEREGWPRSLDGQVILVSADANNASPDSLGAVAPARFRPMPSIAYRLALAAAGDAVYGTSFKGAGDWDYAAGQALLRGVGGDLFGHDGQPATYSAHGESRSKACFGGAPDLRPVMLRRSWMELFRRVHRDPSIPRQLATAYLEPGASIAEAAVLRRAHGCLLGQLAGDALGSLVEFQPPDEIRRHYPGGLRDLADGGTYGTIAGQSTDDSELALALARTVVAAGRYDPALTAASYAYWYATGPFDVGSTTGRALAAAVLAGGLAEALDAAMQAADRTSQSNGSLMRVSPLGIWGRGMDPDQLAEVARADSRITHPNIVCQEACAVFVLAVSHAVNSGEPPRDVYTYARDWAERSCADPSVVDAILAAERTPPADFTRDQGWVLVALQNAFYRLLHAETLEEGVVETAMAGGDTDTNAAIAGALLGAVHGREAVPLRWRNPVLTCRPLAGAPGVRRPRPRPFWPVDALALAERLLLVRA